VVSTVSIGSEAELVLSKPEGRTTIEVEFPCGIEKDKLVSKASVEE